MSCPVAQQKQAIVALGVQPYSLVEHDFNYFYDYYGEGGIYDIGELRDVTLVELQRAVLDYQQRHGEWEREHGIDPIKGLSNFVKSGVDSIARELLRDQVLANRGFEPIGCIFSPEIKWPGIEHLQSLQLRPIAD